MCGRYSLTTPPEAIQRLFRLASPLPNLAPRYNIAPTQDAPVVGLGKDADGRGLAMLRWGLVPFWSDGPDSRYSMINARAETVRTKPAFRAAFKERRCLVPADGFYEWQAQGSGKPKQPWRFVRRDETPFAFAGLWEHWAPKDTSDAEPIRSFSIIVTDANALVRPIHDRMPVIIEPEDHEQWLSGEPDAAEALLRPCPPEMLRAYKVGTRVNSPRNDDTACIEALEG
ncbi:MAG TPA: SOS response-associated peptidase [Thermohalobaculum sp.]|nr:SOS response-associated peptidase [Thermohalobaculum sp.]